MNYQDTLSTLERLHSLFSEGGDDSVFTPAQKRWISALHKSEMGEGIRDCGCKNKYTDAVTTLLLKLRRRGAVVEEVKYRLRAGVLIWVGTDCYSRHNLTDEVARQYLALHPEAVNKFERIDKNND